MIGVLLLVSALVLGMALVYRVRVPMSPGLGRVALAQLVGLFVFGWVGYGIGVLFSGTQAPLTFSIGTLLIMGLISSLYGIRKRTEYRTYFFIDRLEGFVLILLLGFSYWIMTKTMGQMPDGTTFVGSNLVYDMGQNLGIVRSFSYGSNLPFRSPFISGTPFPYHFLFFFLAGLLEYAGLPLDVAVNSVSILSMTTLLSAIYSFPSVLSGKRMHWQGITAVVLSITNSTLTAWYALRNLPLSMESVRMLWQSQTYYASHPYDGSNLSIFWTLNTWVNQRHFVFGTGIALCIWMIVIHMIRTRALSRRHLLFVGLMIGGLPLFHTMSFVAAILISAYLFISAGLWKQLRTVLITSMLFAVLQLVYLFAAAPKGVASIESATFHPWLSDATFSNALRYGIDNFGLLIFAVLIGFFFFDTSARRLFAPLVIALVLSFVGNPGIEVGHKYMNMGIIFGNIIVSYVIVGLWNARRARALAIALGIALTISGIINLPMLKNEFRYPIATAKDQRLINFFRESTDKRAIVVSSPNVFDPVVLAGRTNYYGLYRRSAFPEREEIVRSVYADAYPPQGIEYVVVSKSMRETTGLQKFVKKVYDDEYLVYKFSVVE